MIASFAAACFLLLASAFAFLVSTVENPGYLWHHLFSAASFHLFFSSFESSFSISCIFFAESVDFN